jgi:uncharacterized protein (DUF427 family)
MKAIWNDTVIAETPQDQLIRIEGNWYFPPDALNKEYYSDSEHRTSCFWKGEAHYYDITVDGKVNEFGAWYYPYPMEGSIERVKKDYSNYVAFWNGVEVVA